MVNVKEFYKAQLCQEAKERLEWEKAMETKHGSLMKNQKWELTTFPPGKEIVRCKWVYRIKYNTNGKLEKYKSQLVAKGFSQ